jgi:hypothetical protein
MKVSRINLNNCGEDQIEYFDVFAPLVICTTESMPDIIESRCFTFIMNQNVCPDVENDIDPEAARKLRHRLTLFRATYLDTVIPDVKPVSRRRLNEIATPLHKILMMIAPKREVDFVTFIRLSEQRKHDEEAMTVESEIVDIIANKFKMSSSDRFRTTEITNQLNKDKPEKEWLTNYYVGRCIKRLGFEKVAMKDGSAKGYRYNRNLIEKLCKHYDKGIDF